MLSNASSSMSESRKANLRRDRSVKAGSAIVNADVGTPTQTDPTKTLIEELVNERTTEKCGTLLNRFAVLELWIASTRTSSCHVAPRDVAFQTDVCKDVEWLKMKLNKCKAL